MAMSRNDSDQEGKDDAAIRKALRGIQAPLSGLRRILEANPFGQGGGDGATAEKKGTLAQFPGKRKR